MKNVFVCYTPYHIYTTLILSYTKHVNGELNTIIIADHASSNTFISENIKKYIYWIDKVLYVPDNKIKERFSKTSKVQLWLKILLIDYYFKKYYSKTKKINEIILESQVYMYHDSPLTSKFILKKVDNISLIEDGLANYTKRSEKFIDRIKMLFSVYPSLGRHPKIKKIYVNDINKLPLDVKHKGRNLNFHTLTNKIQESDKDKILNVFLKEEEIKNIKNFENNLLLITQPLSEDGKMSESKKINIYKKIISNYNNYNIFIKPHPREKTNYIKQFKDIVVLDKGFPLEILNFYGKSLFKIGITLFSSAINNISFIEEKIILGVNYFENQIKD